MADLPHLVSFNDIDRKDKLKLSIITFKVQADERYVDEKTCPKMTSEVHVTSQSKEKNDKQPENSFTGAYIVACRKLRHTLPFPAGTNNIYRNYNQNPRNQILRKKLNVLVFVKQTQYGDQNSIKFSP